ncbi:MAG: hypothetical protein NVSMB67_25460 [Flavisolibacter sp.]
MKLIILFLSFLLVSSQSDLKAQSLANTNWKAFFASPLNDTITIHFKTDSSFVTTSKGESVVSSKLILSDDTVSFEDYDGIYACAGMQGKYKYSVSNGQLNFKLVDDPCDGRQAITEINWMKSSTMPSKQ